MKVIHVHRTPDLFDVTMESGDCAACGEDAILLRAMVKAAIHVLAYRFLRGNKCIYELAFRWCT